MECRLFFNLELQDWLRIIYKGQQQTQEDKQAG